MPSKFRGVEAQININMPGCGVFSNSTSGVPNATLPTRMFYPFREVLPFYAGSVGTAGCVGKTGDASNIGEPTTPNATKTYTQKNGSVMDPYADLTIPTPDSPSGSCIDPTSPNLYPDKNNAPKNADGQTLMTLPAGRYCSLDTSNGGGKYAITLSGGVYVFDSQSSGGRPTVEVKNGSLTGTGVTLEFTSSSTPPKYPNTMLAVEAGGSMSLTAPTSGTTAGFVIMGDRTMPFDTVFDTTANADTHLSGTVYLPNGELHFRGNPVTGSNICLQIIANTVQLQGDSSLTNIGCVDLTGGQKPIGSVVTLVK